jgi:endonuclease YncB( thermonuclease family)
MDGLGITKKYSSDAKLAELETKARTARAGLWVEAQKHRLHRGIIEA